MKICICLLGILSIFVSSHQCVLAQAPPPPPKPDESKIPPVRNIDLSKVPIPEADKKSNQEAEDRLTSEERKAPKISLTVMPVGFVPPPIIYIDKAGMPREKYRNPLEYAPVVFHVKTEKSSIRLLAGPNNLGVAQFVPKREIITIYKEAQLDEDADPSDVKRGPRLIELGTVRVPRTMTHGIVVVSKDPASKYWRNLKLKLIDVSPSASKSGEVKVVNMSTSPLGIGQRGKYQGFRAATISKHVLNPSKNGATYYTLAAGTGDGWKQVSETGMRVRSQEQIIFLAWAVPRSKVIPTGTEITTLRYRAQELPRPVGKRARSGRATKPGGKQPDAQ